MAGFESKPWPDPSMGGPRATVPNRLQTIGPVFGCSPRSLHRCRLSLAVTRMPHSAGAREGCGGGESWQAPWALGWGALSVLLPSSPTQDLFLSDFSQLPSPRSASEPELSSCRRSWQGTDSLRLNSCEGGEDWQFWALGWGAMHLLFPAPPKQDFLLSLPSPLSASGPELSSCLRSWQGTNSLMLHSCGCTGGHQSDCLDVVSWKPGSELVGLGCASAK